MDWSRISVRCCTYGRCPAPGQLVRNESSPAIVDLLAWRPVRGSSSRGGGDRIGHIVDGPRGPAGVVKAGLLTMAQFTGLPIIPTITSAERRWVLGGWDRFMLPKAFSRVIVRFGTAITIPETLDAAGFEAHRLLVEEWMRELYDDTDRTWGNPERIAEVFTRS